MGSSRASREALGLNSEVKQRLRVSFGHAVAPGGGFAHGEEAHTLCPQRGWHFRERKESSVVVCLLLACKHGAFPRQRHCRHLLKHAPPTPVLSQALLKNPF